MAVKLYVGGLSYSTTSEQFAPFGTVESATVITDRYTTFLRAHWGEIAGVIRVLNVVARLLHLLLDAFQRRRDLLQ